MNKPRLVVITLLIIVLCSLPTVKAKSENIKLAPVQNNQDLTRIIQARISKRNFKEAKLEKEQLSLILWAAGGVKIDGVSSATRTIPSAGATYPLEFFVIIGDGTVNGIKAGVYHYNISNHSLEQVIAKDIRKQLSSACLGQTYIQYAPVSIVVTAEYSRTTNRYGERGIRYVHMEVGHSCQNIYLTVTNLGLSTVEVGAFNDEQLKTLLGLDESVEPLIVMPVGYSK